MYKLYENRLLQESRDLADDFMRHARMIVFIGYSLPEADYDLRCLLVRAISHRHPRIVVIEREDEEADDAPTRSAIKAVGRRYKLLFGERRVTFRPIGLAGLVRLWDEIMQNASA
jgi:hypothetical protein